MHQSDTETDNINVDDPNWIKSIVITPLSPMSAARFWYGNEAETCIDDKEDVISQTRADKLATSFTVDRRFHIVDQTNILSVAGTEMKIEKCTVEVENGVLPSQLQSEDLNLIGTRSKQRRNATVKNNVCMCELLSKFSFCKFHKLIDYFVESSSKFFCNSWLTL
jgi:hypothetical protein